MIKKAISVLYLLLIIAAVIGSRGQQSTFVDWVSNLALFVFLAASLGDAFKLNLGSKTNWQRIWVVSSIYILGYSIYLDHRYGAQHGRASIDLITLLFLSPIMYMGYHYAFGKTSKTAKSKKGNKPTKPATKKVEVEHHSVGGTDQGQALQDEPYILIAARKLKAAFASDWGLPPSTVVKELAPAAVTNHTSAIEQPVIDVPRKSATYTPPKTKVKVNRKPFRKRKTVWVACIILLVVAVSGPISDWATIRGANPTIKSLAQQAGMSRTGELLFLRASPQIDTDAQIETDCSSNVAANNSNGFIEQGCYNPQTNRIYIRQMPQDLYSMEVATAAYEMLHIVYLQQVNQGNSGPLNKAIEANYSAINDTFLNTQVANFAKTESGYRDLELFSLLGTGYSNLSPDLANYYQLYFSNIQDTIDENNQVAQTFQDDENQLTQLNRTYNSEVAKANNDLSTANTAYYDSTTWAGVDQSQEDYNYNIYLNDYNLYSSDIDSVNQTVDSYNSLVDITNSLITEYNGQQPVSGLQNATVQQKSSQ